MLGKRQVLVVMDQGVVMCCVLLKNKVNEVDLALVPIQKNDENILEKVPAEGEPVVVISNTSGWFESVAKLVLCKNPKAVIVTFSFMPNLTGEVRPHWLLKNENVLEVFLTLEGFLKRVAPKLTIESTEDDLGGYLKKV